MDEFFDRQISVMRNLIDDYRNGRLDLNLFIQRIEGLSDVIGVKEWSDGVFPIVLTLEQVNAAALDTKAALTEADKATITTSLRALEVLIESFQGP